MYIIAVLSLMRVESRSSACVNKREFADIRFILFVPLCDCSIAAPMRNVFDICSVNNFFISLNLV